MAETAIEWTERSWNPIVGCSIVSPGCTNCYAMKMARRIELMGTAAHYAGLTQLTKAGAVWTGKLALAPEHVLLEPLRRQKPTTWFVNSMGDLFHEDVPDAWIDQVFAVMALHPQHTFQVLTKRPGRMRAYVEAAFERIVMAMIRLIEAGWPPAKKTCERHGLQWSQPGSGDDWYPLRNVWKGTSVEDQKRANERVPDLLATPAAVRFVSAEPLLGGIRFDELRPDGIKFTLNALTGEGRHLLGFAGQTAKLDWIIVGGESGSGARPMHPDWPREVRDQCAAAGTAFFFKQWGEWKNGSDFAPDAKSVLNDGTVCEPTKEALAYHDRIAPVPPRHPTMMRRVGKKAAGRILDGAEHNAMPEVSR